MSLKSWQKHFGNKTMLASIFVLFAMTISTADAAGICDVVKDGLVACYPFNGNANDASGNGNNGTVNSATLTTDRFGYTDSAYQFNGKDSFILVPDATILNPATQTISVWVKGS